MGNECYEWLENIVFGVLTMRMKFKWKSNWAVSLMDTGKLAKPAIKPAYNSTCFHSDIFEINTCKY